MILVVDTTCMRMHGRIETDGAAVIELQRHAALADSLDRSQLAIGEFQLRCGRGELHAVA